MKHFQEYTTITEQGTLTLPANIMQAVGLSGNQEVVVETTPQGGIMLRPATNSWEHLIEDYTEERIAEFASEEEALGRLLDQRLVPKP